MIGQLVDATFEVLGTTATEPPRAPTVPGGLDRPFTAAESLMAHLDTVEFPWTVQLEARVEGHLDAGRLRRAVRDALRRHPMGLGRRRSPSPLDTAYRWEEAADLDLDPVAELHARDDADHAMLRAALLGTRIPLDAAPLVRCWLIHRPGGDSIVLSASHVLCDGIGALRLLRSVARAYGDLDDGTEPVSHDEAIAVLDPASPWQRAVSVAAFLGTSPVQARNASRIAVDRPAVDPPARGAGVLPFRFHTAVVDLTDLSSPRHVDATVNDLLLGALHLAIEDWNADHATETGRVGVMMPVNRRDESWWTDVVANLASATTVSTVEADREDAASLLAAIARQTRHIKRTEAARGLDDVLAGSGPLPVAVKRFLPVLLPLTGDRLVDTAVLSNLGVAGTLEFGRDTGVATELWFSPPARMPLGVGVGAVTHEGDLHLTFRCCDEQFGPDAASAFAGYYQRALEFLG